MKFFWRADYQTPASMLEMCSDEFSLKHAQGRPALKKRCSLVGWYEGHVRRCPYFTNPSPLCGRPLWTTPFRKQSHPWEPDLCRPICANQYYILWHKS